MADKLDPGEKLLAGLVLTVVGLIGLVYRFPGYGIVIGDLGGGYMFYSWSHFLLPIIISSIFIIVAILGMYIVYDTIKKDAKAR